MEEDKEISYLQALYRANDDFRGYVDRYARNRHILIDVALTHKIVKEYAMWMAEQELI